jgi:predicted Zn-dependent protease
MSFSKDRTTLAAILRVVPLEMHSTLAVKATTKDAWDAIKSMRAGDAHVREAKVQTLLKEFDAVRMKSGETIDELAMRMNGITNKMRTLGKNFKEVNHITYGTKEMVVLE